MSTPASHSNDSPRTAELALAAVWVVFADIGTSPLYAMRQVFAGIHPLETNPAMIMGVLSLIFWSLILMVGLKYVIVMMRADNRGEGGALALMALVNQAARDRTRLVQAATALGVLSAALFFGDCVITPAITTLAATDGLRTVAPAFGDWSAALAGILIVFLFAGQRDGAASLSSIFGPVMVLWFVVLGALGIRNIALAPQVLHALSPYHAFMFLRFGGWTAFLSLGVVVLAITGCEALYTEMGVLRRLPIRLAWYLLVLPTLILNYFGQGALLLTKGKDVADSVFFQMAPNWGRSSLVGLSILAALIAGHAVVSGAFSMTRQAIQLGYLPRLAIVHTSQERMGHIYIPVVNWLLMTAAMALIIGFGSTASLAAAYGVAVTGTMLIGTTLLALVMWALWGWTQHRTTLLILLFLMFDLAFFGASLNKIIDGGWVTLAIAGTVLVLLTTWKNGRLRLVQRFARDALPVDIFLESLSSRIERVPGIAIFLTATGEGVPMALMHNLKHNKIIHERVVICTVVMEGVPFVVPEARLEVFQIAEGFDRIVLRFGFMEEPNIPKALAQARSDQLGFFYEPTSISYFLSRETLIPKTGKGLNRWREQVFAWMSRSASGSMDFFHLPPNRVVELGTQVEL